MNIALGGEVRFEQFIQLATVKLQKYLYGATAGKLARFIIDLIYYAFSRVQSGNKAVYENRYRIPKIELSVK